MKRASSRAGSEVRAGSVSVEQPGKRQTVDVEPLIAKLLEVLASVPEGLFFQQILVKMRPSCTGLGSSLLRRVLKAARIQEKIASQTVGAQKRWRAVIESSESSVGLDGIKIDVIDKRSFVLVVASTTEDRGRRRSHLVLHAPATQEQIAQAREKVASNLRKMSALWP